MVQGAVCGSAQDVLYAAIAVTGCPGRSHNDDRVAYGDRSRPVFCHATAVAGPTTQRPRTTHRPSTATAVAPSSAMRPQSQALQHHVPAKRRRRLPLSARGLLGACMHACTGLHYRFSTVRLDGISAMSTSFST